MSLTSTNTYVEPTAGTALNTARLQQNDNFRSLLANFRSTSAPTSVNLTAAGAALAIPDGMLYRSATTNALYISDSVHKKTTRVGGNFTRVGIGHRIENSYTDLTNKAGTYEIGELVAIVSADTGQTGHGTLYLCAANAGSISDFIQIGSAEGYTTDVNDNVTFTGQAIVAPIIRTTANVGIRTDAPEQDLHVVGNALVTMNVIVGEYVVHSGDLNTYTGFPSADTYVVFTNGVERLRATSDGKVGVHTSSPTANFHVTGNAFISTNAVVGGNLTVQQNVLISGSLGITTTAPVANLHVVGNAYITGNVTVAQNVIVSGDVSTASDIRLKTNVMLIDNALRKITALEGVYYDRIDQPGRRMGVIAQQVEPTIPEAVITHGDYKTVTYGNMAGLLIEAIKELRNDVENIKRHLGIN